MILGVLVYPILLPKINGKNLKIGHWVQYQFNALFHYEKIILAIFLLSVVLNDQFKPYLILVGLPTSATILLIRISREANLLLSDSSDFKPNKKHRKYDLLIPFIFGFILFFTFFLNQDELTKELLLLSFLFPLIYYPMWLSSLGAFKFYTLSRKYKISTYKIILFVLFCLITVINLLKLLITLIT